jgi:DNA-binding MarR family transcriptional regulator
MTKEPDLEAVAAAVERLSMWLRRQAPVHVSSTTITTLDTLDAGGPLRISDLAERESISQPGMTTLVNRLGKAGLAARVADPTDGRATLVRITDAGRALLAERRAARVQTLLAELRRLSPDDRTALVAALPAVDHLTRTAQPPSLPTPELTGR